MNQEIAIVTDSSCDLSPDLLGTFGIDVVPLVVHFGSETYPETDLPMDEFWEKAAGPHHPTTSQPSILAFEQAFERLIAQGKQVLCLTVTSKHSGTLNAAQLAAQRFGEAVKVFDSLSFSLGLGLQALFAAQASRAGQSMSDILASLEELRERMRFTIILDTLENLRRGGRAAAFIGVAERMRRALNLRVIANAVEGQLKLLGAARSLKGALNRVQDLVEQVGPLQDLAVVHTRSQQLAEQAADQLAQRLGFPRDRIWLEETGAVLSTHAGPGVIAVLAIPRPPSGQPAG
jgi:DegV family protein with EDD domain